MNKIIWCLKQLLPFSYFSEYKIGNKTMISCWKMWLGKCYNIREYEVVGK
jgi:hypothetical protein